MASQEYGVNTVLISKANINMSEDEIEVVQQEIDKGADAIIVKMVGGSKEYSKLKKIQKKVPIMLAGESPDNNVEKISYSGNGAGSVRYGCRFSRKTS